MKKNNPTDYLTTIELKNELVLVLSELKEDVQLLSEKLDPKLPLEFIESKEVCKMLGITLPTLLDWRKRKIIPYFKIANKIRFLRSDIENSLTKIEN